MNNSYTTNTVEAPCDLFTTMTGGTALSHTNLIEERDERTRARKKRKKKYDSIIGLSHDGERQTMTLSSKISLSGGSKTIRLLDEGFCDNGFILKKGTIEKFLNGKNEHVRGWKQTEDGWGQTEVLNLTEDFVGTVNLGHMEFATFPFIIGEWSKQDLTLVDIENDRKALNVDLRLDEESMFVKELARQPYDIGVSAEFYYHINEEDTESMAEVMGAPFPVVDEIFIFAYGLVGECGNVNSSGLELKGETMSQDKEKLMAEEEVMDTEETTEEKAELGVEEIDITATEEAEEEVSEDAPEESEETEDEAEEEGSDEEDEVEEAEDEDSDGDEDEVEEVELSYDDIIEEITTLRRENAELKDHIEALKAEKRGLKKKLQNEYDAKKDFLAKTANLSAELYPNEAEVEKEKEEEAKKLANERKYYKGDGIAD